MKTPLHRTLIAGGLALSIGGGIIVASAATLGGLTADNLGADNTLLDSCNDGGLSIAYGNTYDPTGQRFVVANAVISSIDPGCVGQVMNVQLTGTDGTALSASTPLTLTNAVSQTVTFSTPAASEAVEGAAIVITG